MSRCIDLTGQRFHKLVAIRRVEDRIFPNMSAHVQWLCQCDCGKETVTLGSRLRTNETKSCGCLRHESKGAPVRVQPIDSLRKRYQAGAVKRNLEWTITDSEFEDLVHSNCYYCGAKPSKVSAHIGNLTYNGVDRINNVAGYTTENAVACCETCNFMKCDMAYTDFVAWILRAAKHLMENHRG